MKKLFPVAFFILLASFGHKLSGANCTAQVNNGNWSNPATWSCGHVPTNGDFVTIPAGITVIVDIVTNVLSNVHIWVYGTLYFQGGQKIRLDCNSSLVVFSGGTLAGDNNGSKIEYCGTYVWDGPGPDPGPFAYPNSALPIDLLSFSAIVSAQKEVDLTWVTASENNNSYFVIERTVEGTHFDSLQLIPGSGTTTTVHYYSSIDNEPLKGISYYRLKQVDNNGQFTYSQIVAVELDVLYPNPCGNASAYILLPTEYQGKEIELSVYGARGAKVIQKSVVVPAGSGPFPIMLVDDCSASLAAGIYTVLVQSGGRITNQRLFVTR
ncbi:MAG TPA: G8 domain-containing protein [Bacteroidia bacterium]